jgi:hypothetical protein
MGQDYISARRQPLCGKFDQVETRKTPLAAPAG